MLHKVEKSQYVIGQLIAQVRNDFDPNRLKYRAI